MNELLSKISSYNIFNYLLPGAVFSILAERLALLDSPNEIIAQLVWYYFIGMVISRFGSIIIEPILKRTAFVEYSEYGKYLNACKADEKLETMVEVANTYRTIATVFLTLLLGSFYVTIAGKIGIDPRWQGVIAVALLSVLFLLSFRKQVGFVVKRINHGDKEAE